jgi:hypothetical protein
LSYSRFVSPHFLAEQEDAIEAKMLEKRNSFVNAAGAAKLLDIPIGFVQPAIRACQLAQLNAPADQEEIEVAGITLRCDDIRSQKADDAMCISEGYIRLSTVQNIRPLIDKLKSYQTSLATARRVAPPGRFISDFVAPIIQVMLSSSEKIDGFSLDTDGHLYTTLPQENVVATASGLSDGRKMLDKSRAHAAAPLVAAYLARSSDTKNIDVEGLFVPVCDLKMTLGSNRISIVYKGEDTAKTIKDISNKQKAAIIYRLRHTEKKGGPSASKS